MSDLKNSFDSLMILDCAETRILDRRISLKHELKKHVVIFLKEKKTDKFVPDKFDVDFYWEENGIDVSWLQKSPTHEFEETTVTLSSLTGIRLTYKEVFGWDIDFTKSFPLSKAVAIVTEAMKMS